MHESNIDEILKEFDFNRVYQTTKALNWVVINHNNLSGSGVRSLDELKSDAKRILKKVVKEAEEEEHTPYFCIETGGFRAEKIENLLSLSFVVTSWESEVEKTMDIIPDELYQPNSLDIEL